MVTADTLKYQSANPIKRLLIKRFQNKLLTLIKSTNARNVLDAGCGEGYLLSFLNNQIKDWHIEAFDINNELVAKAKHKTPNASLTVQDIYNCNYPDRSFDLVINTEVLEHLQDPRKALNEMGRLTKKWVILSVPNEPFFSLSNFICGKNILRLGNDAGHLNRWSTKSFIGLISRFFVITAVSKPFPWTIILCEKKYE